jgi:predicted small secreted protein
MRRKINLCWAIVLLLCVIVISGCETIKGAAQGMQKDWATLKKADAWMRKNLW